MKTNKLGKILVVALFVMLFALVLTVSVGAADATVTTADDLTTALDSAVSGDTITVSSTVEITVDTVLTVPAGVTVTGAEGAAPLFKVTGENVTLTVSGEGAINGTANIIETAANGVTVVLNGCTLTATGNDNNGSIVYDAVNANSTTVEIAGAKLVSSIGWAVNFHDDTTTGTGTKTVKMSAGTIEAECVFVWNTKLADLPVSLELTGGSITATNSIVYLQLAHNTNKADVKLSGATLKNTSSNSIMTIGTGTAADVTVSAGTVTSSDNFASVSGSKASSITISGGTITSTKNDINGGLIWVSTCTDTTRVTVTGGKITSLQTPLVGIDGGSNAVHVETSISGTAEINTHSLINENGGKGKHDVTVSGGKIVLVDRVFHDDGGDAMTGYLKVTMTGGEITAENIFDNVPSMCCPCTFTIQGGTYNGGTYVQETNVAKIGETYYATLQAALNAANDGDTIELVGTQTLASTDFITVSKSVTITGGHDGTESLLFYHNQDKDSTKLNFKSFLIQDGVSVTFTGNVTYINCGFRLAATSGTATVTFAGNVKVDNGDDSFAISGCDATGGKIVINVKDNAYLRAYHVVHIDNAKVNTVELNVSGGTIESTSASCVYIGQVAYAKITVSGGCFTGVSNALRPVKTHCDIAVTGGTFDLKYCVVHGSNFTGTVTVTGDTVVTSCSNAFLIEADEAGVTTALTDTVTVKKNLKDTMTQTADIVLTVGGNAKITSTGNLFQIGGNLHVKIDIVGSVTLTCKDARFFYLKDASNDSTNTGEWTVINIGADTDGNAPTLKFAQYFLHWDSVGGDFSYYNLNVSAGVIESTATSGKYRFISASDANAIGVITVSGGTFRRAEGIKSTSALLFIGYGSGPTVYADISNTTIKDIAAFWSDADINWGFSATLRLSGNVNVTATATTDYPALFHLKNSDTKLNLTIEGGTFITTGGIVSVKNSNATATVSVSGGTFTSGSHTFESNPGKIYLTVTKGIFNTTNTKSYFIFSQYSNAVISVECASDDDVQVKGFARAFSLFYSNNSTKPETVTDPKGEVTDGHLFVTVTGGTYVVTDRVFSHTDSGKGVYRISGGKFTAQGGEGFGFYTSASGNSYIYITGGTWKSTLKDTNWAMFGSNTSAKQFFTFSGGTYTCTNGPMFGYAAELTAKIEGGTFNAVWLLNGNGDGSTNGAVNKITVDLYAPASVTVTSALITDGTRRADGDLSYNATVNIYGGTVTAPRLFADTEEMLNYSYVNLKGSATVNGWSLTLTDEGAALVSVKIDGESNARMFDSLAAALGSDAVKNATGKVTVTLLGDMALDSTPNIYADETLEICGDVEITGKDVKMLYNGQGPAFLVKENATLTLSGSVTWLYGRVYGQNGATVIYKDSVTVDCGTGMNVYESKVAGSSVTVQVTGDATLIGNTLFRFDLNTKGTVIVDGGTLTAAGDAIVHKGFTNADAAGDELTVTLKNVTFTAKRAILSTANSDKSAKEYQVTMTMESGTYYLSTYVVWCGDTVTDHTTTTVINGGTFIATAASGSQTLFHTNDWQAILNVTINAGTFKWENAAARRDSVKLYGFCNNGNIMNVTVLGGSFGDFDYIFWSNRQVTTVTVGAKNATSFPTFKVRGAVFYAYNAYDTSTATMNATVYGGTFEAAKILYASNASGKGTEAVTMTVYGGTFTTTSYVFESTTGTLALTLNGGTFTSGSWFIRSAATSGTITMTGGTVKCSHAFVVQGDQASTNAFADKDKVSVGTNPKQNADGSFTYEKYLSEKPDVIINVSGGSVTASASMFWMSEANNVLVNISGDPKLTSTSTALYDGFFYRMNNVSGKGRWSVVNISGSPTITFAQSNMVRVADVTSDFTYFNFNISGGTFVSTSTAGTVCFFRNDDWNSVLNAEISGGTFRWGGTGTKGSLIGFCANARYHTLKLTGGTFESIDRLVWNSRNDTGAMINVEIGGSFKANSTLADANTGMLDAYASEATVNVLMTGGSLSCTNGPVFGSGGTLTANVTGGEVNAVNLINMNGSTAKLNVTIDGDANVKLSGNVFRDAPNNNNSHTNVNLQGGSLTATRLYPYSMNGTATVNMTGGTYNGFAYVKNENGVCRIGDTYYASLQAAINAVSGDTPDKPVTITLVGGMTIDSTVVINKNVIITGNGGDESTPLLVYGRVTAKDCGVWKTFEITPGYSVTFSGNVHYHTCGFYMTESTADQSTTVTFAGRVHIDGVGELGVDGSQSYAFELNRSSSVGKLTLNVADNAYLAGQHAIRLQSKMDITLNITGGTIYANKYIAVYVDGSDASTVTLNMSGGTFNGTTTAVQILNVASSNVNITGGTFEVGGDVILLKKGKHTLSMSGVTVNKASVLVNVQENGVLESATIKNFTVKSASYLIYVAGGATLGTAAQPAVLEGVTATATYSIFRSDWSAGACVIHVKSGTYTVTNNDDGRALCSRGINDTVILGTEGGSNKDLVISATTQLIAIHHELHNSVTAADRGTYSLTIYSGTFSNTGGNLIDMNRGIDGTIVIHGGEFTAKGSNVIDMEGDEAKEGTTSVGYNKVDLTINGGTFTSSKAHFIHVKHYTGTITLNGDTATANSCGVWAEGSNFGTITLNMAGIDLTANSNHAINLQTTGATNIVNVSGGRVVSTKFAIEVAGGASDTAITVTGGYLEGTHVVRNYNKTSIGRKLNITVSGGTLKSLTSAMIWSNCGTVTVNIGGDSTQVISGGSGVKATDGSKMNVDITGGSFNVRWRVVEIDNAICDSITVKNITVVNAASVLYYVDNNTKVTRSEVDNVTVANSATNCADDTLFIFDNNGEYDTIVLGNVTVNAVFNNYVTFGSAKAATMTVTGGSATAKNYVFNITWNVTALDLTVSGGTFSGTRVFHAFENPDANRGIEIAEATTVRGEGKFNVKITVTGGELSATDRVLSAVDGSNVYFHMTGGTLTAKNSGSCVLWSSDHTDVSADNKNKERAGKGYLYALIEGGTVNSAGFMLNTPDAYTYLRIQNAANGTGPVFGNASWLVNIGADTGNSAKAYVTVDIAGGTFTDVNSKGGGICIASGCTNVDLTKPVLDVKISGGSFSYAWELIKLEGGGDVNVTLEGTTNASAARILALWTNATATLNATVTGGTYHGSSHVFDGLKWNTDNKTYADSAFTVSGGTFTSSSGNIFNFYDGSLVDINVSGGTFTPGSGKAFMYLCATISNINVSGGEVTGCGNIFHIIWGDSSKKAGDAKYTDAQVVVYISGDFTANATGYAVYGAQKNSKTVIDISGGTLRAATTLFAAEETAYLPIYITGGELSALTVARIATGGAVAVTGLDDANATVKVNGEIVGAHISYVPSEGTKVWTDLTGLQYAPDNTVASLAGDLTVSGTATISGKLTLTGKGSFTGSVVFFTLADGAELTLDGEITYNGTTNLVQVASGVTGNVTVTFAKGTYLVSSTSKGGALFLDQSPAANTTVNICDGAYIKVGGWGVAFGENRDSDGSGIKTVNMTGGYLNASHGITFAMGGVQGNVTVSGGAIETVNENFYFDNKHFDANGQSNVISLSITGGSFVTSGNVIVLLDDTDASIIISNIAVNGVKTLLNMTSAGTVNVTLNDVTATATKQILVVVDDAADSKCKANVTVNGGAYTVTEDSFLVTRYATVTVTLKRGTDESEPVITVAKYIGYAYDEKDISYKTTMNWNVEAGELTCGSGIFWYANDTTGTVTISGGSFTCTLNESNLSAMSARGAQSSATFNISGGTFTSAKTPMFGLEGTLNATISGGVFNCLYLVNANDKVANETVTVSGNAVINCDTAVLTDGTAGSQMTLNISGGTVTAPVLQERPFQITCKVNLTGGVLNVRDLTVNGAVTDIDVVRNQRTGYFYKTLQEAVNAAEDNDTLVLLTNVIVIREAITFGGKHLTITGGTADEPIKVLGIVDNAKYVYHTYATFVVGNNASLTFTGYVEWLETGVVAEGDNVSVTFAGNVKFDNGKRSDVFYNNNSFADGTVSVTVTDEAQLLGDYVVYFTGNSAMTSTDKIKTVTMNGGLIDGRYGILFQNVNGVTGNVILTGGTIRVTGSAIWLQSANVDGKRITVELDGVTIESNGLGIDSESADLLVDVIVKGNTLIHAGMDASGDGDYCIKIETNENVNPSTVKIYGGTFITDTGHATVHVTSRSAARQNASSEATATKAYIYGGYFKAHTLGTLRSASGGYLYIFGGYICFDANAVHYGSPVRSGTGSSTTATVGNVYIYGGNFATKSLGAAINNANDVSNVVIKAAGVNVMGGAYLYNSTNTADRIYYPDGMDHKDGAISMTDGAGVRIVEGSNGLRFVSVVTKETLDYINSIKDSNTEIKFGTLIAPADIVEQAEAFTKAELDAADLLYLDIEAKDGLVARSAGGYYIRAAITNIKAENYGREFAAVGYVTYVVNGAEVTIYTTYREPKNARSIEQVARMALRDGDSYSAAQQAVLRQFAPDTEAPVIDLYLVAGQSNAAGSTQFSDAIASLKPEYTEGYSHIYYSGSSNRVRRIVVPMKIGYGSQIDSFGAELGIADALSQYYNEETGRYAAIIKYAYGGTSLYDSVSTSNEGNWLPPTWIERYGCKDEQQSGALFRAFINHVESSVSDYEAMGYEVNIQSVYWMQGENDISANAKDNLYSEMFRCWIDDVRSSVAEIMCDESYLNLPVIVGEISEYFNGNDNETYHKNNLAFVQMQREVIGSWDNVYVIAQGNVPGVDWPDDDAHWGYHDHLWSGYMTGSKMLELAHGFYTSVSEEDAVAEVWLDGQLLGVYNSLGGAISMAPEGAVVKLIKDIQMYTTLAIGNRNTITLDGCGHTIDFTPKQCTVGNYAAIKFYNTDITVKDLRVINHSYTEFDANGKETNLATYGAVLKYNAKVTWIGGYLEAERHGFVMNNAGCELTVVSGEFKLRDTAISYASIFYTDAKETKITVEGGSFDAGVGTAYVVYTGSNANGARIVLNGGTFKAGDKATNAIMGLSTTATIIVSEDAVLTGNISNAGLSQ